jgi:hypothetical protein
MPTQPPEGLKPGVWAVHIRRVFPFTTLWGIRLGVELRRCASSLVSGRESGPRLESLALRS